MTEPVAEPEPPEQAPHESLLEEEPAAAGEPRLEEEFEVDQEVEEDVGQDIERTQAALAELTSDLKRLQAEFVNYKRRVERDRDLVRENARFAVLAPIIEVLDTIDRAREHGPLEGGFKAVAEQLERTVTALGLSKFGEVGEPFDPTIHEALSHIGEDPEVEVTTCKVIAKAGYRISDRVVRAAQVLVVDPVSSAAPQEEAAHDDEKEPDEE